MSYHNEPVMSKNQKRIANEIIEETKQQNIKVSLDHLSHVMQTDPDYAHSWHCNLAMAFYDAWGENGVPLNAHKYKHQIANEGASRCMKQIFNVETSNDMLTKEKAL